MWRGNGSALLAVSLILAGLSGLELALTPSPSSRPPAYLADKLTQAGEEGGGWGLGGACIHTYQKAGTMRPDHRSVDLS